MEIFGKLFGWVQWKFEKKNTTAFATNNVLSNKDHTKVNKDYDFLPHPTYFLILASRKYLLFPELVEMARLKEIWLQ